MDSGRERKRGLARLLAVCTVLLGLFLMHGAPTAAADGCHGAMAARTAAPTAAAVHGGHAGTVAHASSADSGMHRTEAETAEGRVVTGAGGHGALCVATAPRDRLPLPSNALAMAVAIAGLAAWSVHRAWTPAWNRRRGPPGGRHLLLTVCIART